MKQKNWKKQKKYNGRVIMDNKNRDCLTDIRHKIQHIAIACEQQLGYTHEEVNSKNISHYVNYVSETNEKIEQICNEWKKACEAIVGHKIDAE